MSLYDRTAQCHVQWALTGALALSLAACGTQPAVEQTVRMAAPAQDQSEQSAEIAAQRIAQVGAVNKDRIAKSIQSVDDVLLTSKVTSALIAEPALETQPIVVRAVEGIVILSGTTDTRSNRAHAESAALNVEGVRAVANQVALSRF